MTFSTPSRFFSPLVPFLDRIRGWRDRRKVLQELADCDPRERDRLLQDLNLTERQLTAVISAGADANFLLEQMLDTLGLEYDRLDSLHPRVVSDLRRVCAYCPNKRRCRRELKASTAGSTFHEFCYNATTLEALAADPASGGKRAARNAQWQ